MNIEVNSAALDAPWWVMLLTGAELTTTPRSRS